MPTDVDFVSCDGARAELDTVGWRASEVEMSRRVRRDGASSSSLQISHQRVVHGTCQAKYEPVTPSKSGSQTHSRAEQRQVFVSVTTPLGIARIPVDARLGHRRRSLWPSSDQYGKSRSEMHHTCGGNAEDAVGSSRLSIVVNVERQRRGASWQKF